MALKSTIFKAALQIADLDRSYYHDHDLILARHPSENDLRMMARLATFILHAGDNLQFGKGVSSREEADLWARNSEGEIELWIELGQVDEKRIRHACSRAHQVYVYTYQNRASEIWWRQMATTTAGLDNLHVVRLAEADCRDMTSLVKRNMRLQCTVQESQLWLADGEHSVVVTVERLR